MISKLALGTVQFGLDYGISNQGGKITPIEIEKILNICHGSNIQMLDTASGYGDSEERIGIAKSKLGHSFQIVTKLTHGSLDVFEQVNRSLKLLRVESIYGLLFHSFQSVQQSPTSIENLLQLKADKKVEKIGVSLYHPEEAEFILENQLPIDIVQIPYNLLDQRFVGLLPMLKEKGIEIHSRSVFLQGLFFLDINSLSKHFENAITKLQKLEAISNTAQVDKSHLALNFVLLCPWIDRVIIGVENAKNLKDNIQCSKYLNETKTVYEELKELRLNDLDVILPTNWKNG